jgi:hypothetical protein
MRARVSLSHDRRRLMQHHVIDPKRIEVGRASIGAASWCYRFGACFGDTNYGLHRDTAHIIKFPERRSDIAKLRAELEEMKRTRGGASLF